MGFVDDGHAFEQIAVAGEMVHHTLQEAMIDFVNDLQMAWQNGFEQPDRPGFQCFRKHGVIGIGEGALANARDVQAKRSAGLEWRLGISCSAL